MTNRITDEMVEAAARAMAYDDNTYDPDDVIDLVPGAVVNGKTDEVIFWELFASKARAALSAALPLMDGDALPPVERDEQFDRTYYPLPGGWEVQTKGKGSTFRLCDTKTGERHAILGGPVQEMIEQMAIEIRASLPLMDGWQPIETAPKDGTRIVLIDGLGGVPAVGSWLQYGFSEEKKFGWFPFENPRFWLPLPPAPKGD